VVRYEVSDADTAAAVGSGDVPVLATPRLIARIEAVTVQAAARFTKAGQTTVGTAVRIEHRRATATGGNGSNPASAARWISALRMTRGANGQGFPSTCGSQCTIASPSLMNGIGVNDAGSGMASRSTASTGTSFAHGFPADRRTARG
jgi:fluoroacetyl-CoA thioesterase